MIIITVAKKPCVGSVASNILAFKSGGLNIDASRIPGQWNWGKTKTDIRGKNGLKQNWKQSRVEEDIVSHSLGRWPANLILEHRERCQRKGAKSVKPSEGYRPNPVAVQADGSIQFTKKTPGYQKVSYTNASGEEIVAEWDCVEECPVPDVDHQGQSLGIHPAGNKRKSTISIFGTRVYDGGWKPVLKNPDYHHDDNGCVSRFFKQVKP